MGWIVGLVLLLGSGGLLVEGLLGHPALGAARSSPPPTDQLGLWTAVFVTGAATALFSRWWLDRTTAALPPVHPRVPASLQADATWEED